MKCLWMLCSRSEHLRVHVCSQTKVQSLDIHHTSGKWISLTALAKNSAFKYYVDFQLQIQCYTRVQSLNIYEYQIKNIHVYVLNVNYIQLMDSQDPM